MIDGDLELLRDLCTSGLRYVHSNGDVDSRDSFLEGIGSGRLSYDSINQVVDEILIHGNAAIMLSRMEACGKVKGALVRVTSRIMAVWYWEDSWKLVALQSSRLPNQDAGRESPERPE